MESSYYNQYGDLSTPVKYKGFVRQERKEGENDEVWLGTNDNTVLLDAPISDVVFAETVDEIVDKFDSLYPATHPSLTRIIVSIPSVTHRSDPKVIVSNDSFYCGGDFNELIALAKSFKKVWFANTPYSEDTLKQEGCVSGYSYRKGFVNNFVQYNPKKIVRDKKAKERRDKTKPITFDEFQRLMRSLQNDFSKELMDFQTPPTGRNYKEFIPQFIAILRLHSALFGPYSWRRNEDFQKFLVNWKEKGENTKNAHINTTKPDFKNVTLQMKRKYGVYDSWEEYARHRRYMDSNGKLIRLDIDAIKKEYKNSRASGMRYAKQELKQKQEEHEKKYSMFEKLFEWLDKESRARKPVNMELKAKNSPIDLSYTT